MTTPDLHPIRGRAFSHSEPAKPNPRALPDRGLYLITPGTLDSDATWTLTDALLASGAVRWLQYRDKLAPPESRHARARRLRAISRTHGTALVINDEVALAAACGADGVHLGEDDGDPAAARDALGASALIGVSCYDSLDRAEQAISAGADYVAFGAFYPSRSKSAPRRASTGLLRTAAEQGWPAVAIGGLEADNVAPIIEAGARWTAMIHGIYGAEDPLLEARRIQELFAQGSES